MLLANNSIVFSSKVKKYLYYLKVREMSKKSLDQQV